MQNQRTPVGHRPKISHVEVYWKTVTYRTVALYVLLILAVVMATLYLIYPEAYSGAMAKVSKTLGASTKANAELTTKQAKFVNLDGKVQVKKVNSVQWVAADYRMALDKGDLIETGSDGAARITFADGTTYTVKADTLVTVEENIVQRDRTRVGVHISSGGVDLATGRAVSADSKAEITFADAIASLRATSRAAVRSDRRKDEHEITVAAGTAEVQRGHERVELGKWERG